MADKRKKAASAANRFQKDKMACNKPQRAPAGDKHKYVVKACQGGKEGIVRFGARGYEDYTQHKDEGRRANFKARHNCSEKKDKLTPGWWSCHYSW
jgi:hypothetical protein